jgi:hypothetical protein
MLKLTVYSVRLPVHRSPRNSPARTLQHATLQREGFLEQTEHIRPRRRTGRDPDSRTGGLGREKARTSKPQSPVSPSRRTKRTEVDVTWGPIHVVYIPRHVQIDDGLFSEASEWCLFRRTRPPTRNLVHVAR